MKVLHAAAFAAGLTLGSAAMAGEVGVNQYGDYVITATGLGAGGFAAISTGDGPSNRRLYLYTGSSPSTQGSVQFFVYGHPPNQSPFVNLTLAPGTDARYLGTFKAGYWPFPSMVTSDYWVEYPTLIANWQTAVPLAPYSFYAINVWCQPRGAHPEELPAQGPGVGVIQMTPTNGVR